jgi:hypothetical protein
VDVVFTTGGTELLEEMTPEATRSVLEKEIPESGEDAVEGRNTLLAALSAGLGVAGTY